MTPQVLEPGARSEPAEHLEVVTLAERLHALGDVPLDRVYFLGRPPTVQDVVQFAEGERKRLCELVDDFLVEKAMGYKESMIGLEIARLVGNHVRANDLGFVLGEAGMVRILPEQVRSPDAAFYAWARRPAAEWPAEQVPTLAPDLAVEVLSPGNTPGEMARKRRDYFAAGVRLYWEVDIQTRTVDVYTSPEHLVRLDQSATLTGGDVLPGFEVNLADLFALLDRPQGK